MRPHTLRCWYCNGKLRGHRVGHYKCPACGMTTYWGS